MKHLTVLVFLACAPLMLTGCIGVRLGTDTAPPKFVLPDSAGHAYATISEIDPYDGTILWGQLFRGGENSGELLTLELWPLGRLDLGLLGIRGKLLVFEAGMGTLFYQPRKLKPGSGPDVEMDVDVN